MIFLGFQHVSTILLLVSTISLAHPHYDHPLHDLTWIPENLGNEMVNGNISDLEDGPTRPLGWPWKVIKLADHIPVWTIILAITSTTSFRVFLGGLALYIYIYIHTHHDISTIYIYIECLVYQPWKLYPWKHSLVYPLYTPWWKYRDMFPLYIPVRGGAPPVISWFIVPIN